MATEEKESKAKAKKEELIERVDAMKAKDAETKETDTSFGEATEVTGNVTDPTPGLTDPEDMTWIPAEGETAEVLRVGAWVRLGFSDSIPEQVQGHIAWVTEAPTYVCLGPQNDCDLSPRPHEHRMPDVPITVQTRDEYGMTVQVDPDEEGALLAYSTVGRSRVSAHG